MLRPREWRTAVFNSQQCLAWDFTILINPLDGNYFVFNFTKAKNPPGESIIHLKSIGNCKPRPAYNFKGMPLVLFLDWENATIINLDASLV